MSQKKQSFFLQKYTPAKKYRFIYSRVGVLNFKFFDGVSDTLSPSLDGPRTSARAAASCWGSGLASRSSPECTEGTRELGLPGGGYSELYFGAEPSPPGGGILAGLAVSNLSLVPSKGLL